MKLVKSWESSKYQEMGQNRPCKFAFAVPDGNELHIVHKPVLCRDFLNDTLAWRALGDNSDKQIYGYTYKGAIHEDYASLVVADYGRIKENLKHLNHVENLMGYTPTTIEDVDSSSLLKDFVWVKGDKRWMTTTVHFSLYTTILRMMTYHLVAGSWEDLCKKFADDWVSRDSDLPKLIKLPFVLPKLHFVQVCGTIPTHLEYMHDYNGWHSAIRTGQSRFTVYGKALNELLAT